MQVPEPHKHSLREEHVRLFQAPRRNSSNAACGVPGVRSYSTVRACLLAFIVRASHVRQHLGVVHRRAPSVHGVIERVLLQTEQHAGAVFMVLTAVYTQRARGLSTARPSECPGRCTG